MAGNKKKLSKGNDSKNNISNDQWSKYFYNLLNSANFEIDEVFSEEVDLYLSNSTGGSNTISVEELKVPINIEEVHEAMTQMKKHLLLNTISINKAKFGRIIEIMFNTMKCEDNEQ